MRLASYNIRKCLGTDRKRLPGRTLDVVNALSADVIALQEVDHRLGPRPAALPAGMITAETDFRPVEVAQSPVSLGWHGQTVLLRRGLAVRRVTRLELPALEPRGALLVEIGLESAAGAAGAAIAPRPGTGPETGAAPALLAAGDHEQGQGTLRVVSVHLALMRRWRRLQLAAIRQALDAAPPMPTAILGDFNEWSAAGGLEPLTGAFRVHAPGRSFPAGQPIGRLDRVALTADLHLRDAGVLDTPVARVASDHLPVWADVREADMRAAKLPLAPSAGVPLLAAG